MLKKNPETYNEIKTVSNILKITEHYHVSEEFLDEAYDFIVENDKNSIKCLKTIIHFVGADGTNVKTFTVDNVFGGIDGMVITKSSLTIVPHYTPYTYSSGSGGSSSNNNNNNNNNNNH